MNKLETPLKPARRIKRIAAAFIDTTLAAIAISLFSVPLVFNVANNLDNPNTSTAIGLTILSMLTGALGCLVCLVYNVLLPYLWRGQSFGMRITRIKIVDEKGKDLTVRQHILRAITVVFTFILTAGLSLIVEIFIVALSNDHRSFNDTIARVYAVDYTRSMSVLNKQKED